MPISGTPPVEVPTESGLILAVGGATLAKQGGGVGKSEFIFLKSGMIWRFLKDPRYVQTVSQLHHLGGRLSDEGLLVLREEVEVLKRQVSGEEEQRVAREFEIRDLKEKIKDLEKVAEASSAVALAVNQKNQELQEDIEALKAAAETFKFETVMAVNGARVVARWELMREWLRKQSALWDLVTALEQYKAVVREEARSKGDPFPLSRMTLLFRRLLIWMWIHPSS
ncbi:hypothetical protein Bca4012_031152 [Brassica carinata]